MADAVDIARYLLWLAQNEPEPSHLTHFQVQKLLYYAQGWSLAIHDSKLFEERIEGWTDGPVIPSVFPKFADYKSDPIPPHEARDGCSLGAQEIRLIEWVWDAYGKYSAGELWRKTHSESPWLESRTGLAPHQRGKRPLGIGTMSDFFKAEYERLCPGLPLAKLKKAREDFSKGLGVKASDIRRKLDALNV